MKHSPVLADSPGTRRGITLIPVLGVIVLLTLFTGLLAQRQVRNHRAFETQRRSAIVRQMARSERDRLSLLLESGSVIEPGRRVVSSHDIPGLPEPVALVLSKMPSDSPRFRISLRVPADAESNYVQEEVTVP